MKFLIYFQDKKLGIYYKHLLESTYSCEIHLADTIEDFFNEFINNLSYQFSLFSSDEALSHTIMLKVESMNRDPAGVFICNDKEGRLKCTKLLADKKITIMDGTVGVQELLKTISSKLGISENSDDVDTKFVRIREESLLKIDHAECDIFIKLSDEKYLKIFKQGNSITADELIRVKKKNIDFLYVRIIDFENFLNSISAYENDYSELPTEEANQHIASDLSFSHDSFYQLSSKFGLNEKALVYANRSMELLHQLIEKDEKLSSYWKLLMVKKNFISEHSLMVGYLSNAILSHTNYANEKNSIKLSLAALLHDVGLKKEKYWDLEMSSDQEDRFSSREIDDYKAHVIASAEILEKLQDIPADIDKIILNHHEKYDGSGYPRGIGWSKLPILSTVFIVAHEFVNHLQKNNASDEDVKKFIELKKQEYVEGYFKDVILALEKIR